MPRILIAAGGTAGHVVPALAVADALRAEGADVEFAGGARAEAELVPAAGYRFHQLNVVPVPRRVSSAAARAVATDVRSVLRASRLLREIRPDAVLGGGGYVSAPVGLAAGLGRVPLVLMEADGHLGVANRMLARFARRVCTALPLGGHDDQRFLVTGRPVPTTTSDRASARGRFAVGDQILIVVFGGSQGARTINEAALAAFSEPELAGRPIRVLHAAGDRDLHALRSPGAHYDLRGYIDGFMDALVAADLVIGRSGGSVWEIAAAGRPAVLVPYPHATQDHQTANAEHLAAAGAAVVIADRELTAGRLASTVSDLLTSPDQLRRMAAAAAAVARPDAAAEIAAELLVAAGP